MDPQLEALLRLLSSNGQFTNAGLAQQQQAGFSPQNTGGYDSFNPLASFSPVNYNPNYAATIKQNFENNPLAGARPFSFRAPLAPGLAGNHAARASNGYWSSIAPESPGASMQNLLSYLQQE